MRNAGSGRRRLTPSHMHVLSYLSVHPMQPCLADYIVIKCTTWLTPCQLRGGSGGSLRSAPGRWHDTPVDSLVCSSFGELGNVVQLLVDRATTNVCRATDGNRSKSICTNSVRHLLFRDEFPLQSRISAAVTARGMNENHIFSYSISTQPRRDRISVATPVRAHGYASHAPLAHLSVFEFQCSNV